MEVLTPREIVEALDAYVIGQDAAKRMVAIAMRNRWRRSRLGETDKELAEEIAPKNIIMMGPTGVGKTEIARRLAKLAGAPFHKVEATKFTEVGYVGRDVESMVRELMQIGVNLVRAEEQERVRQTAEERAEERLLDLLLPSSTPAAPQAGAGHGHNAGGVFVAPAHGPASAPTEDRDSARTTREKLRGLLRAGKLDEREVELEITQPGGANIGIMAGPMGPGGMPGMDDMEMNIRDMLGNMLPGQKKKRRLSVADARELLLAEEADKLIDMEKVAATAKERVEEGGIIFLDELDKTCTGSGGAGRGEGKGEVSREGVQRDLLPIVEGSTVNTKHGMVKTDHILFIAAGAFHHAKPSDLIPELQGRFPLRVELHALDAAAFYRILTEPDNALTRQYQALLATEGVTVSFTDEALREVAAFAEEANRDTDNIGARRLATVMERILQTLSFEAPQRSGESVTVDVDYVRAALADVRENRDLTQYIL